MTIPSAATTTAPIATAAQPNGSFFTSGYLVNPGTGSTSEHWSVVSVMPSAVAHNYSEVDSYDANTFFPKQAAINGTAVPRLPQDGGQLTIAASAKLILQGTGNFAAGAGGQGGLADISANQILVVDSATRNAILAGTNSTQNYTPGTEGGSTDSDPWAPIVLAADDLRHLEVESVLLGGSRTFASDGVHVNITSTAIVVANDASDPVVLPDIQLIAAPRVQYGSRPSRQFQFALRDGGPSAGYRSGRDRAQRGA